MGFEGRTELHDEICDWLVKFLNSLGYPTVHYGAEHTDVKKIHDELRHLYDDKTACFIKHQPDIISKIGIVYVIEVKSLNRYDTPNFSIELDSYNVLKDLHKIGCRVIVAFNTQETFPYGLKCSLIENLELDDIRGRDESKHAKGSRTAYGLIKKSKRCFAPFEQFIGTLSTWSKGVY